MLAGVAASLLIQWLKNWMRLGEWGTLFIVLVVSFAVAAIYAVLQGLGLWEPFVGVLMTAGAVYTFIIRRFEEGSSIRAMVGRVLG